MPYRRACLRSGCLLAVLQCNNISRSSSISQLRELDVQYEEVIRDVEAAKDRYEAEGGDVGSRRKALLAMQRALIKGQEIGDEKLQAIYRIERAISISRQLQLSPQFSYRIPVLSNNQSLILRQNF